MSTPTATVDFAFVGDLLEIVNVDSDCQKTGCNCIACPPTPTITPHIGGHCGVCGNDCHVSCG